MKPLRWCPMRKRGFGNFWAGAKVMNNEYAQKVRFFILFFNSSNFDRFVIKI
jgi:hypothetical protein